MATKKTSFDARGVPPTGVYCVSPGVTSTGSVYTLSFKTLVKSGDKRKLQVPYRFSTCESMGAWQANISGLLNRVKMRQTCMGLYVFDACYLETLADRVKAANREIKIANEAWCAHYDENRAAIWDELVDIATRNKRRGRIKELKREFDRQFPSKDKILSAGLFLPVEQLDASKYGLLPAEAQLIIDDAKRVQDQLDHLNHIHTRFGPVLGVIAKLLKQAEAPEGKISGKTITSYLELIDAIKPQYAAEFNPGIPDLDAFLSISDILSERPIEVLDAFKLGWMHFYWRNGMADYFPYDEFDAGRVDLEYAGTSANGIDNSFVALANRLLNP